MSADEENIRWHAGHVTAMERQQLLGHRPATIWLTGLSGAGKSTLAFALERHLIASGCAGYVLDGDNVRHGLNRNLGFAQADRSENIRRIAEVARLMNDAGLVVITAFISPYRADRDMARRIITPFDFFEVHMSAPLAICEARDPKGMYRDARAGKVKDFTGVSAPYEPPLKAELTLDSSACTITESVAKVMAMLMPNRSSNATDNVGPST